MTLPLCVPLPAPAAALLCLEQWVDVKANVAASDGKQEAWKGGDLWSGGDSWTGGDSWNGGWSS